MQPQASMQSWSYSRLQKVGILIWVIHGGVPSSVCLEIRERSYSNFLASTVKGHTRTIRTHVGTFRLHSYSYYILGAPCLGVPISELEVPRASKVLNLGIFLKSYREVNYGLGYIP